MNEEQLEKALEAIFSVPLCYKRIGVDGKVYDLIQMKTDGVCSPAGLAKLFPALKH